MSRTFHHHHRNFNPRKEAKPARKMSGQKFRAENHVIERKLLIGDADFENVVLPKPPRTSGWLTW